LAYPPAVPTGVTAIARDGQALFTWSGAANAWGYNVKGSATDGGPYALLATNLQATAFIWSGLTNGSLYYFVLSSANALGESANSGQTSVRPVSAMPPRMNSSISASHFQLNWPADHTGWRLQMKTDLTSTNWQDIPGSDAGNYISIPPTNLNAFFRLVYP